MGLSGLATSETGSVLTITSHEKLNILEVLKTYNNDNKENHLPRRAHHNLGFHFSTATPTTPSLGNVPYRWVWWLQMFFNTGKHGLFSFQFTFNCCCTNCTGTRRWSHFHNQAAGNNETLCALKDADGDQSLPPVGDDKNHHQPFSQGECDGELWRRDWWAGLEPRGPSPPLDAPVSDARLLLGLRFK